MKFEELTKRLGEKDAKIKDLKSELDKLKPKSPLDTSDDANSNFGKFDHLNKSLKILKLF